MLLLLSWVCWVAGFIYQKPRQLFETSTTTPSLPLSPPLPPPLLLPLTRSAATLWARPFFPQNVHAPRWKCTWPRFGDVFETVLKMQLWSFAASYIVRWLSKQKMKMGKRQNNGLFVFDWFKMLLRILLTTAWIRELHDDSKSERRGVCCSDAAEQNQFVFDLF